MKILGIESSADETAAAVLQDGYKMLSNVVASSLDLHTAYGGIVPEIAARSHIEVIIPVIEQALDNAKTDWKDIDAIAVTQGPGLIGSLLIGVLTASTLAIAKNKPLYGINHVLAHTYANFITKTNLSGYKLNPAPSFPFIGLIISGGHTQLMLYKSHKEHRMLGQTSDDAVGEAFDKVAKILGLPYPGGPSVNKAAQKGNPDKYKLPKAKMDKYQFSFSGLKTATLRTAQQISGHDYTFASSKLPEALNAAQKADLAASFQKTAIETLLDAVQLAIEEFKPTAVVLAGGVAANLTLRDTLSQNLSVPLLYPNIKLCTDNAAMIASAAYFLKPEPADPYRLEPLSNL